jgi:stearoyl-CoA desaturase (delta-9 desaturase)
VSSGSPLAYTVAHRTHHLYSDTEKDPHGSHIGFLNVMLYKWNLKDVPIRVLKNQNEKWIKFTNRYYALIIISFFMSLFMIDFRYALMYSLSVLVVMIGNAWVNYGNHLKNNPLNYRNFETKDDSHNDLIGGYLFGEWHNNHHKYPSRYNERIKWWEFDLAAQFIKLIKK